MKPFDIELAKQGHPVVTRAGNKVRIICFDVKGPYPVVGLVDLGEEETAATFTEEGLYIENDVGPDDLFMAPVEKRVWFVDISSPNGFKGYIFNDYDGASDHAEALGTTPREITIVE